MTSQTLSNETQVPQPTAAQVSTIGGVIRRSAARLPDKVALTFAERSWTYRELDAAVDRVAHQLLQLGLVKGDRVAAYGKNSDAYLLLFLGCARAGLVHVPINFNAVAEELVYLLTQSGPRIAFVDADLAHVVDAVADEVGEQLRGTIHGGTIHEGAGSDVLTWALDESGARHEETDVADGDLVQLLYTSGTTARAKGAMLTHGALIHEYVSCLLTLDFTPDDVPLHSLPLYHSAQMHVFLMPGLMLGMTNHLVAAPDLDDILRRVPADGITSLFFPPTVWVGLANHPGLADADLSALRRAYYGASIMPVPILHRMRERLPDVGFYNCFGQSEIGPLATVLRPEDHEERPDSIGRPVPFVETRVVDKHMADVAPGESGEVVYRSPQLCLGYWDMPEATEEAFAGGWFHSGDLVRIDEQGYMFVVDRIKDVVNTGGVMVASREVEEALYGHPAVAEVAVIGIPDERWIEAITALVITKAEVAPEELMGFAREHLARHKVPKHVHLVDTLPKNPSGKLLKRELRDEYGGFAGSGSTD